ncbi:MAG: hypothetical protein GEV00_23130, partial [Actinophytocola sp.]|nr:hypothetical protein [Actinophytocola sp.]
MALATVEVLAGLSSDEKRDIMESVRRALVAALQVPPDDPAIRLVEHPPDHVIVPPRHSGRYAIIQVTMFEGRTEQTKRRIYSNLANQLAKLGFLAGDVQIVVYDLASRKLEPERHPSDGQRSGIHDRVVTIRLDAAVAAFDHHWTNGGASGRDVPLLTVVDRG